MNENAFTEVKKLLCNGKYAEAEAQLNAILKETPDDWQAKMMYGSCRLMQGDTETAKKIQAEIEAHYEETPDIPPEEKSFWQKYKKLILYTAGAALVLAGTTAAAAMLGESVSSLGYKYGGFPMDTYSIRDHLAEPQDAKYGGPPESRYEHVNTAGVHVIYGFEQEKEKMMEALTPSEKVSPCPADKHDWETLYTIPLQNGKLEKQSCRRCHTTREVLPPPCAGDKHEWEFFEDGKSGTVYRCRRCGSKQKEKTKIERK